jgi:hypothetical protein
MGAEHCGGVATRRKKMADKKEDMVVGDHSLAGAVKQLEKEHPIDYMDRGPHHGRHEHETHIPLHGMKPCGPMK